MSAPATTFPVFRVPSRQIVQPATIILICAAALTTLGLTILFSASASLKPSPYFYLSKQITGVAAAGLLCLVASRINLDYARRYAWWVAGIMLVLLALVLIPHLGVKVGGSRRWLGHGALRLQVSEFGKLAMVFCLAHYLALNQTRLNEFKRGFLYPLGIIGIFAGLILKEPDLGTAALAILVGVTLVFLAGARWRYILPTIPLVLGGFALLVMLMPNRLHRFTAFLDVEANKQGGTYQLYQSMAAFAVGGVNGAGLGEGRQQLGYTPEAHNDFIFSVVGEELGLVFTLGVVAAFATIFIMGLRHMRRAPNLFHFLLASGCVLLICLQAIINIGVVTGLFPTKGMSLPFISAGLSNLLLMGLLLGLLLNNQRTWGRAALPGRVPGMREV
ncbi:MAG TPA: putative peptidoglycan glycosyltransferase FtsW [Opitutaceae bacterium]|nr:putative peptidoglycan glycosyltransferase FtsW [Opitutaceae bacterium]